jgi:dTDP-4-dehydrorhamnose 3,5-epimerase
MKMVETELPGIWLITPKIFSDSRGTFLETWNLKCFEDCGLPVHWVQDTFYVSARNVIRGIRYQITQPQAKVVRVTHGSAVHIAVDLRRSSPFFGRHIALELIAENGHMLYIPIGFGHGFAALADEVGFSCKATDYYYPQGERTIVWNDPQLNIPWRVSTEDAILPAKDELGSTFFDAEVFP